MSFEKSDSKQLSIRRKTEMMQESGSGVPGVFMGLISEGNVSESSAGSVSHTDDDLTRLSLVPQESCISVE